MKKDKNPTSVIFYLEHGQPLAVFTRSRAPFNGYRPDNIKCYSHAGQHSQCHRDYLKKLPIAKPGQYEDLQKELESIGYRVKISARNLRTKDRKPRSIDPIMLNTLQEGQSYYSEKTPKDIETYSLQYGVKVTCKTYIAVARMAEAVETHLLTKVTILQKYAK